MKGIPRVQIDELITKYSIHPELIDIYVEGDFDKDFLEHYLVGQLPSKEVSIIPINLIEISNQNLAEENLTKGSNKNKLIYLSRKLSNFLKKNNNVSCLVDADFDRLNNNIMSHNNILYTDYTCSEMYGFNDDNLIKFFKIISNLSIDEFNDFKEISIKILPVQFTLRSVIENLELNSSIPKTESGLTKKRDLKSFNIDKYIISFLDSSGHRKREEEIKTEFLRIFERLPEDIRHKAQGHDFIYLLYLYTSFKGKINLNESQEENHGGRIVISNIEKSHIVIEPLFAKIIKNFKEGRFFWECA